MATLGASPSFQTLSYCSRRESISKSTAFKVLLLFNLNSKISEECCSKITLASGEFKIVEKGLAFMCDLSAEIPL